MQKRKLWKDYEKGDRFMVRYIDEIPYLSNQFTDLPHWRKIGRLDQIMLGGEVFYFTSDNEFGGSFDFLGFGEVEIRAYQIQENPLGFDEAVRVKDPSLVKELTEIYDNILTRRTERTNEMYASRNDL